MSFSNFGNQFGGNFGNNFGNNIGREAAKLRRSPLAITLIALFVLVTFFISISSFYADLLWFRSVGFSSVWRTTLVTKVVLFVGAGLITALAVLANVIIAYRNRPVYAPMATQVDNLERYRTQIEPKRRLFALGIFALFLWQN